MTRACHRSLIPIAHPIPRPSIFRFELKNIFDFSGRRTADPTRPSPTTCICDRPPQKFDALNEVSPSYNFFRNNWARISRLERCSQRISSHSCQLSISILTNKWEQGICKEPHKRINGNCFNARSSVGHLRLMCFISIWSFLALKTDACLNYEDCSH